MQKTRKLALLIFISLSLYSLIGAASAANTYNITDSSYSNYFDRSGYINNTSIQAGDELDLSGTIKNKDMYIDRPLNITSSTKTAQILNGTITILAGGSGTNITNLKINNSNQDGIGIFLYKTENNTIKGNQIHCNGPTGFGMALTDSNYNKIMSNTVITTQRSDSTQTHSTIVLGGSNNNIIEGNTVKSDGANCIYLSLYPGGKFEANGPSSNNQIKSNTVVGVNTSWCRAIQIGYGSHNTVESNKILSQTFPEKTSSYGMGAYYGISCDDEGGNTIIGNTISAIYYGIYANSNCIVSGNTISNYGNEEDGAGIFIAKDNCTIANNTINMSSGYGIYLMGLDCNVTGNKITTNGSQESVYIYYGNGTNITGNTVNAKSSTYAINTSEGTNTTVTNNYLVSAGGNKLGDEAVKSRTGDTVNGNTPASVTLTPGPDYYKNSVQVTLTMNKPGTIYYTLNGTTPTKQSTSYNNTPISISKTTTLKFITVDAEGNTSPVQSKTYTIDTTKPQITKIDPANGANKVATSKTIKVTFNENIKAGSKLWVELKNSSGKAVSFKTSISGKVLTIDPTSNLAESLYTLCIHSGAVTDLAGNPVALKTTKFSVGTAPTVSKIDPKDGSTKVAAGKTIKVTFNENIKKGGKFWVELKNSGGKIISTTNSVSGKVLTVNPKSNLAESLYTLCIHTGAVTDLAGNPVALKTSKFSTGTPPTIKSTDPKNNAKNIARNKAIKVTFNENIKKGSNYWIELKTNSGKSVKITKSISGKVLTIKHTAKLAANTKYKLVLHTAAVTDKAGNPAALKIISFTTGRT